MSYLRFRRMAILNILDVAVLIDSKLNCCFSKNQIVSYRSTKGIIHDHLPAALCEQGGEMVAGNCQQPLPDGLAIHLKSWPHTGPTVLSWA